MPEHDHKTRVRLTLPPWLHEWPRGLRPHAATLDEGRVEFLYRAPQERWFLVALSLTQEGTPLASEGWGPDAADLTRLARALRHRLHRSPEALAWLHDRIRTHRRWRRLRALGGRGTDPANETELALDRLLGQSAALRLGAPGADAHVLETAHDALGDAAVPLLTGIELATGNFEGALKRERANAPLHRDEATISALVAALRGDVEAAAQVGRDAAELAGPPGALEASQLLQRLGLREDALSYLLGSLPLEEQRRSPRDAFRRAWRVAVVARSAGSRSGSRAAAERMARLATTSEERRATAQAWEAGGEFDAAERILRSVLEKDPEHPDAALDLATLRLFRSDAAEASSILAAHANAADGRVLRTLGISAYLRGDCDEALAQLDAALKQNASDGEARIWRAEVLAAMGDYRSACDEIGRVSLGDHTAWQLVRAYVEEMHEPGRRTSDGTWFIVRQLLVPLLAEQAPPSEPSHAEAIEALRAALRLMGGYRGEPVTTWDSGSLLWRDDVVSPRRRAERLQETVLHTPLAVVVERFEGLAQAHPDVPFFRTYAAELALWLGDYERAFDAFMELWRTTRTRWGYVGAGAAALFLEEHDKALAIWKEGLQHYTYLDAEATYCYRGELYLMRGELELAEADLQQATRAQPKRLGAWINLALLQDQGSAPEAFEASVAVVAQLCPAFWWEARQTSGSTVDALLSLRRRMRGNRASGMYSVVDEGVFRVVGTGAPERLMQAAREQLGVLEEGLLARLAANDTGP